MVTNPRDETGTALVAALFFILALSVTATVIVWVTGSERRVSYNEYSHTRAFHASDAGTERAINWIRTQRMPPAVIDTTGSKVESLDDFTEMHGDHKYKYDVEWTRVRFRPGWSREYLDYDYTIDSTGESVMDNTTRLEVRTSRLFRQGY